MAFELRINGRNCGTFPTQAAAVARASEIVRETPDIEPEIIDTETGHAAAPGASKAAREDLAKKIGY